jgi:tetratricopeptide (TPR) repeat protein
MFPTKTTLKSLLATIAFILSALAFNINAQQSQLGKVVFPTPGSEKAQVHFMRGLAALHSFWFEEALDEFRESTKIDPEFVMGYWGEAMSHNHPLWAEQDTEAARKTLAKIKDTSRISARERAYVEAIRILYGEGDKLARDRPYSAAMEKLYRDFPDDLEAACFYSLSLLGTVRPGDKGFKRQALAGAIALDLYSKNPDHPGAAHFIIHSFDDPEHAILALPAARRYAEIAPEAHHARHMPAHIFLQLGMWPEAAASNESAWAVSDAWVKRKGLALSARDYHSLHWLAYVYLQQGRYAKAEQLLPMNRKDGVGRYNEDLTAAFVVETERWTLPPNILAPMRDRLGANGGTRRSQSSVDRPSTSPSAVLQSSPKPIASSFIRGLAAAKAAAGSIPVYRRAASREETNLRKGRCLRSEISGDQRAGSLRGRCRLNQNYTEAIDLMKRATAMKRKCHPVRASKPDCRRTNYSGNTAERESAKRSCRAVWNRAGAAAQSGTLTVGRGTSGGENRRRERRSVGIFQAYAAMESSRPGSIRTPRSAGLPEASE